MSFLSRLFGSKSSSPRGGDIEARLEELEKEAEKARPGYVGSALNRAGDLALKAEQHDRAVGFYGRAIDAFLDDAQRELARGVANKIIRVRPTAIRTLCTITWLDLAARHQASALMHLRDYVNAAAEAGQQQRAATQIHLMAKMSPDSEFIDAVADSLDALDYPRRAKEVRGWIAMGAPDALDEALALSDACMQAAVRSNDRDLPLLVDDPEAEEVEAAGADEPEPAAAADSSSEVDATEEVEAAAEADADAGEEPEAIEAADAEDEVAAASDPDPEAGEEPDAVELDAVEADGAEASDVEAAGSDVEAAEAEATESDVDGGEEEGEAEEAQAAGSAGDGEDVEGDDQEAQATTDDDEASATASSGDAPAQSRKGGKSRKSKKKRKKKKKR